MRPLFLLDLIADFVADVFVFWGPSDTARIEGIERARKGVLETHDEIVVDSSRGHLLLCTRAGMYLVSRRHAWKAQLTDLEVTQYKERGRRAFSRIEKNRKRLDKQAR
jgi:hypothetical protein